jgi:hypothetical protein
MKNPATRFLGGISERTGIQLMRREMNSNSKAEQQPDLVALWAKVQAAYARSSQYYLAGDNPEYAKALAAFDRAANPVGAGNVLQFRRRK